ncbi:hypothetical protein [Vibrio aquaticus]|uniref:hypothetical protein n=1 Tax=Vibrio aquaticus TaxID=2496559 RepID=UPI00142E4611|nr:hypothetical protein [Vibrio aquaticus]
MSQQQFEAMRAQIKKLTPQQLRMLKGAINNELEGENQSLVTNEELQLISSLFA